MKIQKNIKWVAAMAAVCLAATYGQCQCIVSTNGNMVGVNFVCNDNTAGEVSPGGVQNGYVDSLQPNEIAGVFPMPNWNNLGRYGDNIELMDSNGCDSGISIAWYSAGMWHCDGSAPFPGLINPNCKLMDGYLESQWNQHSINSPLPAGTVVTNANNGTLTAPFIYLKGINSFVNAQGGGTYSILVYTGTGNDTGGRQSMLWLEKVTEYSNPPEAIVDGATNSVQYYITATNMFDGSTFLAVTGTNAATITWGNYAVFKGLTDDEVLVRGQDISAGPGTSMAGIQIVALGQKVPPQMSPPAYSPANTVYAGSPVTISSSVIAGTPPISYQWETDGGLGGDLSPILNATNLTLNFITPLTAASYRYCIVGSNTFGVSSSITNTLTVLAPSAPLRTSDINIYSTNVYGFIGGGVTFGQANFGAGTMPITNQWLYSNGGAYAPVAGVGNNPWTLTNIVSGSTGNYRLSATNQIGSSNSTPAHLTALADPATPSGIGVTNMYAYWVMTNQPWAYWRFEETNDTIHSSMQAYDYSGHNFDATYGNSDGTANSGCLDGAGSIAAGGAYGSQYGPNPAANFAGFNANNGCATMSKGNNNGYLTVPPLNLNTNNNVTFTMWIYISPNSLTITPNTGLLMNRNGLDAAGVCFGSLVETNVNGYDGSSVAELGYVWNQNSPNTYTWNSHLFPSPGTWNFVACTITPTNTTMYLYYLGTDPNTFNTTTNLYKASQNNVVNSAEAFSGGTTWLGSDNWNNGNTFDGSIDEVAVFTNALSEAQIQALFLRSLGLTSGIPPFFSQNPANTQVFMGGTFAMTVNASAVPAPYYQWQTLSGTTWSSMGTAVGRTPNAATLSYSNFISLTLTNYRCVATNLYGAATSSVASVSIIPLNRYNVGWTVNFNAMVSGNGGPNVPYVGHGVLGNGINTYWNGVKGYDFANTRATTMWDDGLTPCPINVSTTNGNGSWATGAPWNNVLLDQYMNFGTNGTALIFTNCPPGRYNLALYGVCASYANRGTAFTVNGVTQYCTNAQDTYLLPDNTVVYSNLLVNGTLEVDMAPGPTPNQSPDAYGRYTEGDLAAAQLQFVSGPLLVGMSNRLGTNFALTYYGGYVEQSTNVAGPWTTNTTVGAGVYVISNITVPPTRFFRVWTNKPIN